MIKILFVLLIIFVLYVLTTACRNNHKGVHDLFCWHYAHRGLHGNGIPENSMLAFRRARDRNYGVELDVHLLADGNLAVIHDSSLLRTTGRDGKVEELTADVLDDYYLEGTMQTIPLFSNVLEMFAGRVPLIVELKTDGKNYAALCKKTCQLLDNYNGVFCLESFDPRCIRWLRKNRPDLIRGQLTENFFKSKTSKLPWILKFLLTHQMLNFLTFPDFVAYKFNDRKNLSDVLVRKVWKTLSVTWTLRTKQDFETALREGRVPIFEGFEP